MIGLLAILFFCLQAAFANADDQPLKGYYSGCKVMTKTENQVLTGGGDNANALYNSNPNQCQEACRNKADCVSASFTQPRHECHFHGSNQRTGPGHLTHQSNGAYFEKNCNSELRCSPEFVHGTIILARGVRKGSVYVKGHYMQSDCFRKFAGGRAAEALDFTFEYNKCGGNKQDDLFWNKTVVVLNSEKSGQIAEYRISCPMRLGGDSNEMRIREPGHAIEDITYREALAGKKEDKIELKLERNAVQGRPEWLKLTISANQGNIGVFPFDCYLISHMDDSDAITQERITAENGCPHDYTKMRAFVPGPEKFQVQALLSSAPQNARRLNVQCTVVTCEHACPLPSCYGEGQGTNNTLDLLTKSVRKTITSDSQVL